jgi:hypothetical protein
MGGRTATLLIAGSACAAVLVMGWSLLAALSLADATPYWIGSIGIICALAAAFLIFKDLVLWPFRFLGPRLASLAEVLRSWLRSFAPAEPSATGDATPARRVERPPARRRH